jgi:hypothetical protein
LELDALANRNLSHYQRLGGGDGLTAGAAILNATYPPEMWQAKQSIHGFFAICDKNHRACNFRRQPESIDADCSGDDICFCQEEVKEERKETIQFKKRENETQAHMPRGIPLVTRAALKKLRTSTQETRLQDGIFVTFLKQNRRNKRQGPTGNKQDVRFVSFQKTAKGNAYQQGTRWQRVNI